jgi:antitoxin component of MazEF toxin-antitoxin module
MRKTIKKIGNSLGIIFNKEECKIYNFKKDDIIELDDTILIKERKGEDVSIL